MSRLVPTASHFVPTGWESSRADGSCLVPTDCESSRADCESSRADWPQVVLCRQRVILCRLTASRLVWTDCESSPAGLTMSSRADSVSSLGVILCRLRVVSCRTDYVISGSHLMLTASRLLPDWLCHPISTASRLVPTDCESYADYATSFAWHIPIHFHLRAPMS